MRTAANHKFGEKVKINNNDTSYPSHRRILEVGFTPAEEIELITRFVFVDPMAFFR